MAKKGFGGGMMPGNMNQILKQAQKMQDNMQKMQQELDSRAGSKRCRRPTARCAASSPRAMARPA